jgi:hypothetical protein
MDAARLGNKEAVPTFLVIEGGILRTSRAEQFCAKADECERRAAHSRDPRVKAQFMDLASQWRQLAEQVEIIAHDKESALHYERSGNKDASGAGEQSKRGEAYRDLRAWTDCRSHCIRRSHRVVHR